ncbi:MAG: PAS domain S-box protein [Methanoregula sp.]|jgi:PAS domain S-box-containing protein
MTPDHRTDGPDDRQIPADPLLNENSSSIQEPSRRPADLRTLIQNLKESEKQLNIRCALLEAIIGGANTAIFSVDTDCRYTNFNKKHADDIREIYGTGIRPGEKLDVFVPIEKDLTRMQNLIRQALAGNEGSVSDYFGDNARSRRYFDLSCYPVCNDTGFIMGAAVIAIDTTQKKQSEKSLSEREVQFRRLAEDAPDLLYRMSLPEGRYEYVSPVSLSFTGYPPEEFYKKPGLLYELIHSSGKDAFGRQLELLINGKNPPAAEFQIVHKNGDIHWSFLRTTLVRDAAGHPVAVEGFVTDITDWKKEQAILEETKERFRTIVESADAGIILVDAETHVIADANPRALEMIGAPREEVIGSVCHRFICPAEAGKCPVTDLGEQVDASERVIIAADGTKIPVLKTVVPAKISGRNLLIESFIDLSEQKTTEDALRQSEERYRTFIKNSSEGVFRFETDCEIPASLPADEQIALFIQHGHVAECNDAMARMYGYERAEDLTGQKLGSVIDTGDPSMLEFMRKFIRDGYHVTDYETEERDRAGKTRWFANTMNGVVKDGHVIHLWGVQRDITDRKNVEMTLRESEERYRELVDHSIDIICTLSFSGEIKSINPTVFSLLGYMPDDVIGKNILDYFKPDTREMMLEETAKIRNGARSSTFYEVEIRAKDGRFIPFEVNARVRSEGVGGPDIIGIARGISDRKKSEEELRESEERFRTLLQYVPSVAVQGFRPDYTVISWNEASTRMFGYTADEAVGKDIRDLLIPADLREVTTGTCDQMAMTGVPGPSTELDLLHRNGTRVPVFVSHAVVKIPGKSTILFCIGVDLTERKKAETALRDAEQRLQSILDVAPFGSFVYELHDDGSLVFISGNQSANRILNTDCTRFVGKTIEEAFPSPVSTGIPDACRNVARGGEPFHRDDVEYGTDEITGVFEIHAVPLGQNRMTVFFRDISETRKAREELEKNETRFRALIQNSSDIIQILDQEKQLVYSSPAFFKILGYQEQSQNNRNFIDLIHPDDRERVAADLEKVYTGTNPGRPTEYRMVTADGSTLYVESIGVNLLGVPGVDGIVINTHAVHERKQAEQALQESEERFRSIFQHSNDAIYLFEITPSGMPGKIVDANDVAVRQTGYAKDELVQKTLLELSSRDLSQRSRAIMMELLTRGEARFETEKIKKDGSLLPVEISARLAKLRDKTYVIAISRDISRRKREERALRIANQKLQLMNIVAWHDIQNKVTGLRGYVELSKDLVTDEKLKKFIDSEEEVLRVIYRQLQYTKEYQEMGIHPPQWVNLPQVLRMIMSFLEIGSLALRMDLQNLELYCDPVIEKVFSHLIENTKKHGKTATEIRISCQETAGVLQLIYEDDGVGIPQEKKKDLFVRGVGSETGFSLFFVHDILEISDMSIRETGVPGKGVRFEIAIPKGLYRGTVENR